MARRCGVVQSTVCAWLSGAKVPGLENRRVLKVLYKIPIDAWDEPAAEDSQKAA